MNSRLQNKISERLSGWYPEQWEKTIVWKNGKLFIQNSQVSDEIVYNIEQELEVELEVTKSTDPSYTDWYELEYNHG